MLKNAFIFRLTCALPPAPVLAEHLDCHPHALPGPQDASRFGFGSPFGGPTVEEPQRGLLVMAAKESYRDLPSAVVNEETQRRVEGIGHPIGRKERQGIKDEVTFDLLPKAFIKHRRTLAVVRDGLLIIDAGSRGQAGRFCSELRQALGGLKAHPLTVAESPARVMTEWLRQQPATAIADVVTVGDACALVGSRHGGTVRVKDMDLQADEVRSHLEAGMHVDQLSLRYKDALTFELDSSLALRRIKATDGVYDQILDSLGESDDARAHALADVVIGTGHLSELLQVLIDEMGGEHAAE